MLKRHSFFFKSLFILSDLALVSGVWLAAYALRFHTDWIPAVKGVPPLQTYLLYLPVVALVTAGALKAQGVYEPQRMSSFFDEAWNILKGSIVATLALTTLTFFFRREVFSRVVVAFFAAMSPVVLIAAHGALRLALREARRRGYNLRRALIVGAGPLGRRTAQALHAHPQFGIAVIGHLTRKADKVGTEIEGAPVLGVYEQLPQVIKSRTVDQVYIALPLDEQPRLGRIMEQLSDTTVDVRVVPDLTQFVALCGDAEMFEGLPLITLRESPMVGWDAILKRSFDVAAACLGLALLSPVLALIAGLVKLTSPGPVLYAQVRMGLDGRRFRMLKFRTMKPDAEAHSGPVWAVEGDPRRTALGTFLRRTSLDELPQLINVLRGEMTLVGPRPERPEFVEQFKKTVPGYMLRHKMKAGITGLAQVKGWRGNTSIQERIKCDLEYIENWSLGLDLKILFKTLFQGFVNKNAY